MCSGKHNPRHLAWSAVLQKELQQHLPSCRVLVRNRATPANRVTSLLSGFNLRKLISTEDAVVITDFTINDNKGLKHLPSRELAKMAMGIAAAMEGAFPYAREFSNWEEVGVIGTELLRNLLICGAVICVVVFTMIPDPKVSGWVILCILLSIVDVLGMLYWWNITINSITTIYVLISVGLAVDYAAHIAHMFKEAKGPAQSRACEALGRIGPCVLNAMISTFLAVLMLSFSKSYVFVTMFRAFCLVVIIAGAHGMWLLPVLLTLFGGDNGEADDAPEGTEAVEELENPSAKGEEAIEDLPPQKEAMD